MPTTAEETREGQHTASQPVKQAEISEQKDVFDPYLYRTEMPFSAVYYPMGFPLELITNSAEVMAAAEESWSEFRPRMEMEPIRVRVGVLDGDSTECPAAPISRAHGSLMIWIADPGNFCVVDFANQSTFAWLTTAAVSHRSYLRYFFLETAALCHIANRYSVPIHGACVALDGHGVMLCGESGMGKSTLAFACARAGWTYVTDDASYLLHGGKGREVVGNCHMVRLRPTAANFFPEVQRRPLTPRANGKPSIELRTADLPGIATAGEAQVDRVVFLKRNDTGTQEVLPYSKEAARRYMEQHMSGVEKLRRNQTGSVDRLMTAEIFELHYRELDWAVDRLERLVREPLAG